MLLAAPYVAAQTAEYQSAVRDAAERYRGDVPSGFERQALSEPTRQRLRIERAGSEQSRAEALQHYMERADVARPYLELLKQTPPGPDRDRVFRELRRAVDALDKSL